MDPASPARAAKPAERASAYVGFRSPDLLKERLTEIAKENGRSLSAEAQMLCEVGIMAEDDSGLWLLTSLIAAVLANLGPAAAAHDGPPSAERTRDWLASSPFAYDQGVRAIYVLLEAFRPPGEPLPSHLREPRLLSAAPVSGKGLPVEIDFNAHVRDLGEGAARLALAAVAGVNLPAPGKLRRLGERIRHRFPGIAERIRANLANSVSAK